MTPISLGLEPHQIIRTGEPLYQELGLAGQSLDRQQLLKILTEHPILIERPIVLCGKRAVLGRPPERVLEILS